MRVTESSQEFHVFLALPNLVPELRNMCRLSLTEQKHSRWAECGLLLIFWRLNQGLNVSRRDKGDVSGRGPTQTPGICFLHLATAFGRHHIFFSLNVHTNTNIDSCVCEDSLPVRISRIGRTPLGVAIACGLEHAYQSDSGLILPRRSDRLVRGVGSG